MENFKVERLKDVLSVQTSSHQEKRMIKYIKSFISKNIPEANVYVKAKNIYVSKGTLSRGENYPCVVAHTDTVHDIHKDFSVFEADDLLFAFSSDEQEQVGIGGDDKSGIWIALEMLLKKDVIKGSFFWGEEIGCKGSSDADTKFFDDVGYCIQCDRRGNTDFITSIYGDEIVSEEFRSVIKPVIKRHKYKEDDGAMTDVYQLKESINVSMVNMSCGYYSPHSDQEVVSITDSLDCLEMVDELIETLGLNRYEHTMVSSYSNYYNANYWATPLANKKIQSEDIYDVSKYEGVCFDCQGELETISYDNYVSISFCTFCHIAWEDQNLDVYSPGGHHVQRFNEEAHIFNTGTNPSDVEDFYYCAEEEKIYKWDEVVVYTDDDVCLLRQRHTDIDPNQRLIQYD